jgi:hypothetical protein
MNAAHVLWICGTSTGFFFGGVHGAALGLAITSGITAVLSLFN